MTTGRPAAMAIRFLVFNPVEAGNGESNTRDDLQGRGDSDCAHVHKSGTEKSSH